MSEPQGVAAAAGTAGAAERPRPGRRVVRVVRVARRHPLAAGVGLLLSAVLALRLWWGWHVGRQLAAQTDALRARGEPTELADLATDLVPDADNRWVLLRRAARLDAGNSPGNSAGPSPGYPPFDARWAAAAAASEAANGPVFQTVRAARGLDRAQSIPRLTSPAYAVLLPHLNGARQLAVTLADGATYRHLAGDDAEAVDRVLDVLRVADACHQDDFAVSQLVGIGIAHLATNRAMMIGPGLRLDDPAVRARTAELIAALLDERRAAGGFGRAAAVERLAATDTVRWLAAGTWAVRPLADREVVRTNALCAAYAAAGRATNAEDARRALDAAPPPPDRAADEWSLIPQDIREANRVPRYAHWFGAGGSPSLGRYAVQQFRGLAERRMAAASLAAQLYRADHGGRWPAALADLAPAYLPAVPADPMFADARPLGYVVRHGGLPGGGDRPLVHYDAGAGGDDVPPDDEPTYEWRSEGPPGRRDGAFSQHRDLARWRPAARRYDVDARQFVAEARATAAAMQPAAIEPAAPATTVPATPPSSAPASAQAVDDHPREP